MARLVFAGLFDRDPAMKIITHDEQILLAQRRSAAEAALRRPARARARGD